jgi:signal transduction histidine kinase
MNFNAVTKARTRANMNAEHLRHLKHELRTPVNHIIGYSELLLEAAGDEGDGSIADLAKGIHASGQALSRLLERNLVAAAAEMDERQMDALRSSVRPVIEQILAVLRANPHLLVADLYSQDLERIRQAATQLMLLVRSDAPA